jgi:hypothetical protein
MVGPTTAPAIGSAPTAGRRLQWIGDPPPAVRFVVRRAYHGGLGGVGQLGYDPDELTVKIIGGRQPLMRLVCHERDICPVMAC